MVLIDGASNVMRIQCFIAFDSVSLPGMDCVKGAIDWAEELMDLYFT